MIEKLPLTINYRLRYSEDRVKALLYVFYQPARFLQLSSESGAALLGENLGVQAVDAQARKGVGVDVDCPLATQFSHYDVGSDVSCIKCCVF